MLPIRFVWAFSLLSCVAIAPVAAQTLQLNDAMNDSTAVEVSVGDILDIEVRADLGGTRASGAVFYVVLPNDLFAIVDQGGHEGEGLRPFAPGAMFAKAVEMENCLLAAGPSLPSNRQMLAYSLVMGPSNERGRSGSGIVAHFQVECLHETQQAQIELFSNPVHETFLVEEDGVTERHFSAIQGLDVVIAAKRANNLTAWATIKRKYAD